MRIETLALGPLETNCYVVGDDTRAVVIDPGGEPEVVLAALQGRTLEAILATHFHFDHIQGIAGVAEATGAPVWADPREASLLDTELGAGGMWGFPRTPAFSWTPVESGEHQLLGIPCQILSTPGHSPGGLSFYFPSLGAVFVGDLLFYRSVGRTDFPGSSAAVLERSVRERIFTLPEATRVYPGHGPATTVGDEMRHNPFFSPFQA
ncbi:MAG TPA: MBL fold metallo-hydrolase [Desulfomicrobiaceae bacterium]|jgi:glyoxylase-like metal-dependent hydrolase (beta-lactamase superfamily II)|nr:hydroxyacylglutathione hydrolase [Desulfomicrobiaceae bacterium]HCF05805.1 MBL fold metallo-hydrolase [Desulfomicrobiaceae bacterium]